MGFKKNYLWGLLVIPGVFFMTGLFRTNENPPLSVKSNSEKPDRLGNRGVSESEGIQRQRFSVPRLEIENLKKSRKDAGKKFLKIMKRVCEDGLCVPPEKETDPNYFLTEKERAIYLRENNLRKGIGPEEFVLSLERRKELLNKLSEFINQDTPEMNPGIYAASILKDLSQAHVGLNVKREYEIKQLNDTLISRWVELDDFQQLNGETQVMDASMLEAELLAVYRYRRMLVDERKSRENIKNSINR